MSRIRAFFGRFKRKPSVVQHLADENGELREFVYLDETSVISLIASRKGAIPASITEALTSSSSVQITSEAGVSNPLASAKVGSSFQSDQSRSLQIVRQSVVQSQFKLLYDSERDGLAISATKPVSSQRVLDSISATVAGMGDLIASGDAIDMATLDRGDLIELTVKLEPDPVFAFSAAVSSMSDLVKDHQEEFGLSAGLFATVSAFNDVLERLLIGLVPVRARVTEYVVLRHSGAAYLVRRSLLCPTVLADPSVDEVDVVAVTDRALYWRDLRHVLFSSSPYTVLCRIKADGLKDEWNPVKMLDILDGIVPGISDNLKGVMALTSSDVGGDEGSSVEVTPEKKRMEALYRFAEDVAAENSISSPRELLREAGVPSVADCDTSAELAAQWEAFDRVAEVVTGKAPKDLDRAMVLRLRTQAIDSSGADPEIPIRGGALPDPQERAQLLECDIVAIYW
jgi:hypothetical protein